MHMPRRDALDALVQTPLDPAAHERLGDAYREAGAHRPAQACYRGAHYLGGGGPALAVKLTVALLHLGRVEAARELLASLDGVTGPDADVVPQLRALADRTASVPLTALDHNRFLRLRTLAAEIERLAGGGSASVVDVGGGDGALALFLPGCRYLLIEPETNRLSGLDLPLPGGSADVVCACHVLEHIAPEQRDAFLDRLVAVSRRHVLLLNPFAAAGVDHAARLQLAVDLTGAGWAREHLECGLPQLDTVTEYARRRGLRLDLRPHGAVGTSFTVTMMHHFANLAGRGAEAARINAYLNSLGEEHLTSGALPSAWLVHLEKVGAA
jgi:hypothetical protein